MGSLEYLAATLPQKDAFFRMCGLMFDEIKTTNKAQLDQKIDAIIGPCSQVSQTQLGHSIYEVVYLFALLFVQMDNIYDILVESPRVESACIQNFAMC